MGQNKKSNRRIIELIIFAVIVVCVGLVLVELFTNVWAELPLRTLVLPPIIAQTERL